MNEIEEIGKIANKTKKDLITDIKNRLRNAESNIKNGMFPSREEENLAAQFLREQLRNFDQMGFDGHFRDRKVFISYSYYDQTDSGFYGHAAKDFIRSRVENLESILSEKGFQVLEGEDVRRLNRDIRERIRESCALIAFVTPAFRDGKFFPSEISTWVIFEISLAIALDVEVYIIRHQDVNLNTVKIFDPDAHIYELDNTGIYEFQKDISDKIAVKIDEEYSQKSVSGFRFMY